MTDQTHRVVTSQLFEEVATLTGRLLEGVPENAVWERC